MVSSSKLWPIVDLVTNEVAVSGYMAFRYKFANITPCTMYMCVCEHYITNLKMMYTHCWQLTTANIRESISTTLKIYVYIYMVKRYKYNISILIYIYAIFVKLKLRIKKSNIISCSSGIIHQQVIRYYFLLYYYSMN